jgi:hypothetical protein
MATNNYSQYISPDEWLRYSQNPQRLYDDIAEYSRFGDPDKYAAMRKFYSELSDNRPIFDRMADLPASIQFRNAPTFDTSNYIRTGIPMATTPGGDKYGAVERFVNQGAVKADGTPLTMSNWNWGETLYVPNTLPNTNTQLTAPEKQASILDINAIGQSRVMDKSPLTLVTDYQKANPNYKFAYTPPASSGFDNKDAYLQGLIANNARFADTGKLVSEGGSPWERVVYYDKSLPDPTALHDNNPYQENIMDTILPALALAGGAAWAGGAFGGGMLGGEAAAAAGGSTMADLYGAATGMSVASAPAAATGSALYGAATAPLAAAGGSLLSGLPPTPPVSSLGGGSAATGGMSVAPDVAPPMMTEGLPYGNTLATQTPYGPALSTVPEGATNAFGQTLGTAASTTPELATNLLGQAYANGVTLTPSLLQQGIDLVKEYGTDAAKAVGLPKDDGSLDWAKLASGGASALGGYLNQQSRDDAAQKLADAQIEAAKIAAEAAKFKPVGVSARFGTSNFGYDENGNLTTAGYTASPEIKALQDSLMGAAPGLLGQFTNSAALADPLKTGASGMMTRGANNLSLSDQLLMDAAAAKPAIAQARDDAAMVRGISGNLGGLSGLFSGQSKQALTDSEAYRLQALGALQANAPLGAAGQSAIGLGQEYLKRTPQEMAAQFMAEQQALLAPSRERELAALENKLRARGMLGMATGATADGMGAANPELEAYANAKRMQDLQLAAQATQGGQQYAQFGAGLASTGGNLINQMYGNQSAAYSPYSNFLTSGQNLASTAGSLGTTSGNLANQAYQIQNAGYQPYSTALQLGTTMGNYGLGQLGAGGDLLRDYYGTQTAAFAPYQTALTGAQTLEGMAQQPMDIGINIGAKGTAAAGNAGQLLATGMTNAAQTVGQNAMQSGSTWGNLLTGAGQMLQPYQQQQQPQGYMFNPYTGKAL